MSGSCSGLRKMVDICSSYGCRFDIGLRFNPSKSQTTVFGGRAASRFTTKNSAKFYIL